MRPSLFFAIFIPIIAALLTTIFIAYNQKNKLSPKMIKILLTSTAFGILLFALIIMGFFL